MPENIFEHTTSVARLTCKPLSILSKTISPQEMSMARGGNGNNRKEEPPTLPPPPGTECDPGCINHCCDGPIIIIKAPDPGNELPPVGGPRKPSGPIFSFSGGDSADSTASVDTSTSADSSGTQDQNGGALDNAEEEDDYYDLINPDDEEDWEDFIDEWDSEEGSSGYEGVDTPEQLF